MTQFARRRIAKPAAGAKVLALTQNNLSAMNDKAAALVAQAQEMTGLKPEQIALLTGVNPTTVYRERSGQQDMGALKRLLVALEILIAGGNEVTFQVDGIEISVRPRLVESQSETEHVRH